MTSMQAKPDAASRNLRVITSSYSDPRVNQLDTRRFAGIFSLEILEANSVDCSDATDEDHDEDFVDTSGWHFVDKDDKTTSVSQVQVASLGSTDGRATSCCHAVDTGDNATEYSSTEINDELVETPDDLRSVCTVATSADPESTMDMMWRPKPKIHMRLADQMALVQARSQAIAMMRDAGLKPTSMIQCRHRGCADILPGIEALKYHLHIHNIGDAATKCSDAIPSTSCESTLIHGACESKIMTKSHSRSKSSLGMQHQPSMTCFPSGTYSVGSFLPLNLSPRESTPDVQQVPSFTTAAKSLVYDNTPSNSTVPVCNESSFMAGSTCRGRRTRKESVASSVAAGSSRFAMFLSPPSSPDIHGRFVQNFLVPFTPSPTTDDLYENCTIASGESACRSPGKLTGSRSPLRALSPTRAMSPIRNGIRRVLSIGFSGDSSE